MLSRKTVHILVTLTRVELPTGWKDFEGFARLGAAGQAARLVAMEAARPQAARARHRMPRRRLAKTGEPLTGRIALAAAGLQRRRADALAPVTDHAADAGGMTPLPLVLAGGERRGGGEQPGAQEQAKGAAATAGARQRLDEAIKPRSIHDAPLACRSIRRRSGCRRMLADVPACRLIVRGTRWRPPRLAPSILFGFIGTVAALLPDEVGLMLNGDPQRYFPLAN